MYVHSYRPRSLADDVAALTLPSYVQMLSFRVTLSIVGMLSVKDILAAHSSAKQQAVGGEMAAWLARWCTDVLDESEVTTTRFIRRFLEWYDDQRKDDWELNIDKFGRRLLETLEDKGLPPPKLPTDSAGGGALTTAPRSVWMWLLLLPSLDENTDGRISWDEVRQLQLQGEESA